MDAATDMGGSEGVTGGEVAATQQTATDTGASNTNGSVDVAGQQQGTDTTKGVPEVVDKNAIAAAARREAETESRRIKDENESLAKDLGYSSYKEFQTAVKDQKEEEQRQQYIEQHGVDPNAIRPLFDEFKKNDPDFQEIQRIKSESKVNQAFSELNSTLKELGQPELKDFSEINSLSNAEKVTSFVQKGYGLADAYKLANFNDILSGKQTAAKQAAINSLNSTAHIQPTGAAADVKDVNVPAGVMEYYHRFFPKWNEEQIKKSYAKG